MRSPSLSIVVAALVVVVATGCGPSPPPPEEIHAPAAGQEQPEESQPAELSGPAAVLALDEEAFASAIKEDFEAGEFDSLDAVAALARTSGELEAGGLWKLYMFYETLVSPHRNTSGQSQNRFRERVEEWAEAAPESVTPRIVLAKLFIEDAWGAHGYELPDDPAEDRRREFFEGLRQAREWAQKALGAGQDDPELYATLIDIGRGEGVSHEKNYEVLERGMTAGSTYLPLYYSMGNYLLPRWHGEPGDVVKLADWCVERTSDEMGHAVYFYLATRMAMWGDPRDVFSTHRFSYERANKAYADFAATFGGAVKWKNYACLFACLAGDQQGAQAFFDEIGDEHYSHTWRRLAFERWRDWAYGAGPLPKGTSPHAATGMEFIWQNVQAEVQSGGDVNAVDALGATPLYYAAYSSDWQSAVALLENGADPNLFDPVDISPLSFAVMKADEAIVRAFLEHGARTDLPESNDLTPLGHAASRGEPSIAKALLEHGADVNAASPQGWTPLHTACQFGRTGIAEVLLAQPDIDVNAAMRTSGDTPLHCAAERGHAEVARLLLARPDCDIEAYNELADTPLHAAAYSGQLAVAQTLIESGANVNGRNARKITPLAFAVDLKHPDVAAYLLEQGADPNLVRDDTWAPLTSAVDHGDLPLVELLLENGANASFQEEDGWSALHMAVMAGHLDILKRLMAEPAVNKDLVTKTNRTLVHQAARSDQPDIARYLVEQGCQLNARNADGLTPLAVAKQRGHEQTAAVLAELGATE